MKRVSNNRRKFLGDYLETQNRERFPEALLCGGLLLSGTLLAIYCLVGGTLWLITAVFLLILGLGLGIVIRRYFPYRISSCIKGIVPLTSSIHPPIMNVAW